MTTLTPNFFRNSYASLKDVPKDQLESVVVTLKGDWITTADGLQRVTRDDLLSKGYPLVFVNAVKPREEGTSRFVSVSC